MSSFTPRLLRKRSDLIHETRQPPSWLLLPVPFGLARGLPRERVALRAPLVALRFYGGGGGGENQNIPCARKTRLLRGTLDTPR
jgi:hypothetical protein